MYPPPPSAFFGHKAFLGGGEANILNPPVAGALYASPLSYTPHTWKGLFRGGGVACIKFGPTRKASPSRECDPRSAAKKHEGDCGLALNIALCPKLGKATHNSAITVHADDVLAIYLPDVFAFVSWRRAESQSGFEHHAWRELSEFLRAFLLGAKRTH